MTDTYADFYGDSLASEKAFKQIGCFVKLVFAFWIALYAVLFAGAVAAICLTWVNFC